MILNDFLLINHFINNETNLTEEDKSSILNKKIIINISDGQSHTIIDRENSIVYHNPTSISSFLFNILYHLFANKISDAYSRDSYALSLLFYCNQYVYCDGNKLDEYNIMPPLIISGKKISVPYFIITSIIEPLVEKVNFRPILFCECKFTDCCRYSDDSNQLKSIYNLNQSLHNDLPVIILNKAVYNEAAKLAHLTTKQLEHNFGKEKTAKIIYNLIFENQNLLQQLITILKYIKGDPFFAADFLKYMQSSISLNKENLKTVDNLHFSKIMSDNYMNNVIKTAADTGNTTVNNQWTQWSMLMGLIEKQLGPMRGSMWPTSETMKKYDDHIRNKLKEKAKNSGKRQLNMEEMLEVMRDIYNHNATEPGKVTEVLMKGTRIWD